jgi:hypothetical protein
MDETGPCKQGDGVRIGDTWREAHNQFHRFLVRRPAPGIAAVIARDRALQTRGFDLDPHARPILQFIERHRRNPEPTLRPRVHQSLGGQPQ